MGIRIDQDFARRIVREKNPKCIVLNAPDGILRDTRVFASELEREFQVQVIVIADPTYGSCDTVDIDALRLGADLAFHIGHNVTVKKFGKITYQIDAYDDVSFNRTLPKLLEFLKARNMKSVGLVAFAQHLKELPIVQKYLEGESFSVLVGKGLGQLNDGQIFGCEFYPAYNIKDKVDAMVLLGSSMFHAIGLSLSTSRPTIMLDPYMEDAVDVGPVAQERLKRAVLSVYKARDAERFGIIIGLKEGQIMTSQSIRIRKALEEKGKKVQLLALREITADRINSMTDIDAFVQTGCPRISVDGYSFSKPVLSVPQADALFELLSGKELNMSLFERKNWL